MLEIERNINVNQSAKQGSPIIHPATKALNYIVNPEWSHALRERSMDIKTIEGGVDLHISVGLDVGNSQKLTFIKKQFVQSVKSKKTYLHHLSEDKTVWTLLELEPASIEEFLDNKQNTILKKSSLVADYKDKTLRVFTYNYTKNTPKSFVIQLPLGDIPTERIEEIYENLLLNSDYEDIKLAIDDLRMQINLSSGEILSFFFTDRCKNIFEDIMGSFSRRLSCDLSTQEEYEKSIILQKNHLTQIVKLNKLTKNLNEDEEQQFGVMLRINLSKIFTRFHIYKEQQEINEIMDILPQPDPRKLELKYKTIPQIIKTTIIDALKIIYNDNRPEQNDPVQFKPPAIQSKPPAIDIESIPWRLILIFLLVFPSIININDVRSKSSATLYKKYKIQ